MVFPSDVFDKQVQDALRSLRRFSATLGLGCIGQMGAAAETYPQVSDQLEAIGDQFASEIDQERNRIVDFVIPRLKEQRLEALKVVATADSTVDVQALYDEFCQKLDKTVKDWFPRVKEKKSPSA